MMEKPRKLKVLIIDDELPMSGEGFPVPGSLEIMRPGGSLPGITSWKTGMQYWRSFRNDEIPDLIVADVRFVEDQTSPLSLLFQDIPNEIPTGLSHLKDFAALSRISGVPVGVGLRTLNPGMWAVKISGSGPEQAMGLLAAHLIGEIAAILGEHLKDNKGQSLDHLDRSDSLDTCLAWLNDKTGIGFKDGLHVAIRDYRKRIFDMLTSPEFSDVNVMPKDYMKLLSWCRQMENSPQPLDAQHDIGLALEYRNGRRDVISLASLYADYDRIATKRLPSSVFVIASDVEEPWKIDDDGCPQIGAFLCRLGKLTADVEKAAEALKNYQVDYPLPANYNPPTLAAIKDSGYSNFTIGLIVLLQFVQIEMKRSQNWEEAFENYTWDPIKHEFNSGIQASRSLKSVLQRLVVLIKQCDPLGDGFSIEDFLEDYGEDWTGKSPKHDRITKKMIVPDWVKWHFTRLVDASILSLRTERGEGEVYTLTPSWRQGSKQLPIPPMPIPTPKVVDQPEPRRMTWLRESLGYQNDYHSVARALADAFEKVEVKSSNTVSTRSSVTSKRKASASKDNELANARGIAGRAFMDRLEDGELTPMLADLCRDYAVNHLKWPEDKWPMWLRKSHQPSA